MAHMEIFKTILEQVMADRYGLRVKVKAPKHAQLDGTNLATGRWTAVVNVPRPNKSDKQAQKIKIEVANVPSYENEEIFLSCNYRGLAPGYDNVLLRVSSLKEIMADKVLAVAGRDYLKARDIWDLKWLKSKQISVDYGMVKNKLADYGETDSFVENMAERVAAMRDPATIKSFEAEMSRFLPTSLQQQMAQMANFSGRLLHSVASDLEDVLAVYQGQTPGQDSGILFNPD